MSTEAVHFAKSGCPLAETLPRDPVPFFSNGDLNFKAHDVGWLVAGLFSIVATWASVWLILKHLSFFYHPAEQRMIVRILFMPIIYAWCSFFSYYFVHQALYWQLGRDCYEAIIIGSFFYLLLSYLSNPRPTRDEPFPQPYKSEAERKAQLRSSVKNLHVKKWMWPLGFVKWRLAGGGPEEGHQFLWFMRILVGQYVVIRPLTTLASVIAEYTGYYCLSSWSPKFVHVWSSATITISVTVAMYAVLQLFVVLRPELSPYSPVLKFLAVKLVVFFTFWQESSLSLLVTVGVIQNRTYWSAEEIVVGLAGLLSCFEMMLFAFMHIKAFSYLPYRALAAPVSIDPIPPSSCLDDDIEKTPSKHLTFAEWSEWDKRVKDRDKEQARLAKTKLPKRVGDLPIARADGTPILQRTKKWPAFVKCIRMTDLMRELGEETKWVARGGKVEVTQDLLEEVRRDDHEAIVGRARPESKETREEASLSRDLDQELRRLRESRPVSFKGTTIDENGNRVLRRGRKYEWSREAESLIEGVEGRDADEECRQDRKQGRVTTGWWSGMMDSLGRSGHPASRSSFRQLPRDENFAGTSATLPRARPSSTAPSLLDNVPCLETDASLRLPAPHRLHLEPAASGRRRFFEASPISPPRIRTSRSANDVNSVQSEHTQHATEMSQDSQGHLPHTTVRPPSFIPPAQLVSPSPPPFAYLQSHSTLEARPLSVVERPLSTFRRSPRPEDDHFARARPCVVPPTAPPRLPAAAFFSAGPATSASRGLPSGAAPPRL
ncbi:hypothetical protein JCM11491_002367 [Sporobolomyces phaffii]